MHRYRELLRRASRASIVPYEDGDVERSSCYVMPIVLEDAALRDPLRERMLREHGVQTSVLYPALHELSAYARSRRPLPRAEHVGGAQITLPLFPHLDEERQDRVVQAFRSSLTVLSG